jgi:tetratricopeptide (TPR) repeat protein
MVSYETAIRDILHSTARKLGVAVTLSDPAAWSDGKTAAFALTPPCYAALVRLRVLALILWWMLPTLAHATEAQDARARELYAKGKAEYTHEHYQAAYDLFKQAYLLSPTPALRWNMASALQGMGHPHEAAEELRAFLRLTPGYADKASVEARIANLDEAQRLLDADSAKKQPPTPVPVPTLIATPAPPPAHEGPRKKALAIALSTVGIIVVGAGLGVGLGLGLHDWHTHSTLGTQQATP